MSLFHTFPFLSPPLTLSQYLGHPFTVLGLQALFGLLEVGVFVFISWRLQVVVHGIGGAGCGCGYCMKGNEKEEVKRQFSETSLYCTLLFETGCIASAHTNTKHGARNGLIGLV